MILGYLQTGQTQQAITFITNSSLVSSQAIRQTADCLRVHQICALVVGKMMHAAELGILLTVSPDSRCMGKDLVMDVGDCVTLVGNLLENAIEELHGSKKEIREITLGIYASTEGTVITCEDTGRGIPAPVLERIFGQRLFLLKEKAGAQVSTWSVRSWTAAAERSPSTPRRAKVPASLSLLQERNTNDVSRHDH